MPVARRGEDRVVAGQVARVGVGEVAEDREVDVRIEVAERQHLEVLEQRRHRVDAREQRRHDDHRPRVVGNAVGEVEARQPPRRDRPGDHAAATSAIAMSAAGMSSSSSDRRERARRGALRAGRTPRAAPSSSAVTSAIGAEVERRSRARRRTAGPACASRGR